METYCFEARIRLIDVECPEQANPWEHADNLIRESLKPIRSEVMVKRIAIDEKELDFEVKE